MLQDYYELVTYKQPTPTFPNRCRATPDGGQEYSSNYYAVAACEAQGLANYRHFEFYDDAGVRKPHDEYFTFTKRGVCDATYKATVDIAAKTDISTDSVAKCAIKCHAEATCKAFAWKEESWECSLLTAISGCLWTGAGTAMDYYTYHREVGVRPTADGCANSEYMGDDGYANLHKDYAGCQHRTRSGRPCVSWSELDDTTVPGLAADKANGGVGSFCRNPADSGGNRRKTIWCYYGKAAIDEWEYCDPIDIPSTTGWSPE